MPYSQNGYSACNASLISTYSIPGTQTSISMRDGAVSTVLRYVAYCYNKHVQHLDGGIRDDWGYACRDVRDSSSTLSNHASGTAIDLNATKHPRGTSPSNNYTSSQIAWIHKILRDCDGVVRWGGDYTSAEKDGMHFEINKSSAYVTALASKIAAGSKPDSWKGFPGSVPPTPKDTSVLERVVWTGSKPMALTPNGWTYFLWETKPAVYTPSVLRGCTFTAQIHAQLTGLNPGDTVQMRYTMNSGTDLSILTDYGIVEAIGTSGVTYVDLCEAAGVLSENQLLRAEIAVFTPGVVLNTRIFRALVQR